VKATHFERAAQAVLLNAPVLVVLVHEFEDGLPHFLKVVKNASVDGLLFEGAYEAFLAGAGFEPATFGL
jgi:hypothetical protein